VSTACLKSGIIFNYQPFCSRLSEIRNGLERALLAYFHSASSLPRNLAFVPDIIQVQRQYLESVLLERDNGDGRAWQNTEIKYRFHFYMTQRVEATGGLFQAGGSGDSDDIDSVVSANHVLLPAVQFVGLWENLIYETGLKEKVKGALSVYRYQHKPILQIFLSSS